ncbi:MAG: DUF5615 family PIN-like protein [Patescibacteria group bacterium]
MLTAVLDENMPRSFAEVLSKLEYRVFDVRDCGLRGSPDNAVFDFVLQQEAILVTSDVAFA